MSGADTRVYRGPDIFGQCRTAALVEAGAVRSTTTVAEWHALCRGATVGRNARVSTCECPCHAGQARCVDCGASTTEDFIIDSNGRCIDREACVGRLKARMDANPVLAGVRARRADVARTQASRGPSKPKVGRCEHCGEPTGGGRFLPGHDAKLKGKLIGNLRGYLKGHYDGDLNPLVLDAAELYARNWMPPALEADLGVQFTADAAQVADQPGFVAARTEARWQNV